MVGSTTLKYYLAAIEDLRAMLVARVDWVDLGAAAGAGSVRAK